MINAKTGWTQAAQCAVGMVAYAFCAAGAAAAELPAPQHYQQNCIACHARMTDGDGSVLYGKNGAVHDLQSLYQRVRYCRKSLDLHWSKAEEMQVVDYLNRNFYRFEHDAAATEMNNHGARQTPR